MDTVGERKLGYMDFGHTQISNLYVQLTQNKTPGTYVMNIYFSV